MLKGSGLQEDVIILNFKTRKANYTRVNLKITKNINRQIFKQLQKGVNDKTMVRCY